MAGRYQEYPEYKDSGVDWLGNIPKSWNSIKFGLTNARAILGGNYSAGESEEGVPLIKMGNLGRGYVNLNKVEYLPVGESYDESFLLNDGDFLFNTRNSLNLVGKVSIWRSELPKALYNSNILKISFDKKLVDSSKYMNYLFNSALGLSQLSLIAKGTTSVAAIYYKELKSLIFMLPPLNEQRKILNFLDHETAKIDTLIAKQEKLIELLKEKRQALVNWAIEQVDTIEVRFGRVVEQQFRLVDRENERCYVALGLFNRGRGIFHKEPTNGDELGDSTFYWAKSGDLIISGQFAWEGSIALASDTENETILSHRYPILKGIAQLMNTEYLWAFLTTEVGDFLLNENSVGAAGRNRPLNINRLLKEDIPVPPLSAQLMVSKVVKAEKKLNKLIEKEIVLLKEKKVSLISAAVTGQIDVTDWSGANNTRSVA